jgi:hypothetical protein
MASFAMVKKFASKGLVLQLIYLVTTTISVTILAMNYCRLVSPQMELFVNVMEHVMEMVLVYNLRMSIARQL